jgi:hypothetical protein
MYLKVEAVGLSETTINSSHTEQYKIILVFFITSPFTLVNQAFHHLYSGSGFKNLICSADGSLRFSGTLIIVSW